jgi:hypothetical protein
VRKTTRAGRKLVPLRDEERKWDLLFTAIRMSHTAACESQSIEFTEL